MDLKISTSIVENILDNENIDVLLNNEQVKVIDNLLFVETVCYISKMNNNK